MRLEEDENRERLTVVLAERHERRQVRKKKKNLCEKCQVQETKLRERRKSDKSGVGKRQQASDCGALEQLVNHGPLDTQRTGEPGFN